MRCILIPFALAATAIALPAPFVKVLSANQQIRNVNATTQTEPLLFTTGMPSESLAMTPSGTLYFADPNGNLFQPTTSGPIPVGPVGLTQIADLDWDSNGLWGFSNQNQSLFFYDLGSNAVTASYALPSLAPFTVTGVAFQPSNGSIFLSGRQGLNNDFLFEVPVGYTSANTIGSMSISDAFSYVADIDFDATGTLYAVSFYHRDFYTVNTSSAATSFISTGPHRDVYAMALNPVPEPLSLFALGIGSSLLLRKRKPNP